MNLRTIAHWVAFALFAEIFACAGIRKIVGETEMMEGMQAIGFTPTWTFLIGAAEVSGVVGLVAGIFKPRIKNLAVLCLMPFAIGAFTVHMSHHHGFRDYKEALTVCILSLVILFTDRRFKIVLNHAEVI